MKSQVMRCYPYIRIERPKSWRCRLFGGCMFEPVRVNAHWVIDTCRWCQNEAEPRQSTAKGHCLNCGADFVPESGVAPAMPQFASRYSRRSRTWKDE